MVAAIRAEGLSRSFGPVAAVTGVTLAVQPGEAYGFLGLNGAGKTTTVRLLSTTLPPTAGTAEVAGYDIRREPARVRERIGVVFGSNVTPEPDWSPARYLRHFGEIYGLSKAESSERARGLFRALRLSEYEGRPIATLSGGNCRKVEIARALLHRPSVLFLDEPTRELDLPSKAAVWDFLKALKQGGTTIFLCSHDPAEIEALCDRVGVIRAGRLVWEGPLGHLTGTGAGLAGQLSARLEGRPTEFTVVPEPLGTATPNHPRRGA